MPALLKRQGHHYGDALTKADQYSAYSYLH